MVRSSEEMAYRMYLADYEATPVELGRPLETWDELTYEEQQTYLRHVQAAFKYLFDHGRISSYLSTARLEKLRLEYRAYLADKEKQTQ